MGIATNGMVRAIAATFLIGTATVAIAQQSRISPELSKEVIGRIDSDRDRLVTIFKDLHQHPELGFMETRSSAIVAKELKTLGYDVKTGIGKTGVVAILRNGAGPTVMYRADMDANAVQEKTGVPYESKVRVTNLDGVDVPVAHMCGHDAHMTWLIGVARVMAQMKNRWSGTLVLIGQPAEELITGARAMVDDGLYTRAGVPKPDYFVALHTAPTPVGMVSARPGTAMAGTDQIDITFHGIGGHGSSPHVAKDPVLMAAQAVTDYQAIVSRTINPSETAVLTVGSIQAGTDNNVIPSEALVKANLRYFNPAVREKLIEGLKSFSNGVASFYGVAADKMPTFRMKGNSPPLVNDPAALEHVLLPLRAALGDAMVKTDVPQVLGSEDAHLLRGPYTDVPVTFLSVGVADPARFQKSMQETGQPPFFNHNNNYDVDLASIPAGAKVGSLVLMELLGKAS